jgi:hypothetical protein
MTAKNSAEKEKKQVQNQQSLHGALASVAPQSQPAPPAPKPPIVEKKPPFEVPEDALRKVLKGEV